MVMVPKYYLKRLEDRQAIYFIEVCGSDHWKDAYLKTDKHQSSSLQYKKPLVSVYHSRNIYLIPEATVYFYMCFWPALPSSSSESIQLQVRSGLDSI